MEKVFNLKVKTLTGELIDIQVETSATIRDLRELILNTTLETTGFDLLYKGRKMRDKILLNDVIKDDVAEFFMIGSSIKGGCVA